MEKMEVNKLYNFITLAPTILGSTYAAMRVKSIMTATEAMKYRDIHTLHNNLVPVITALPINPADCLFMLLENRDGEQVVLAVEYIDPASIVLVATFNIRVEFTDALSDDVASIRARFLELGHANINITTY